MNLKPVVFGTIFAVLVCGRLAAAQAPYVGASVMGDIVRTSHSEGPYEDSRSGESMGFSLRVGAPVGPNWGVELEFARPSAIKNQGPTVYPCPLCLAAGISPSALFELTAGAPVVIPELLPIRQSFETRSRYTTLSATLFATQTVAENVSLVYLGGAAFSRTEHEFSYGIAIPALIVPSSRTIVYGVRPLIGLESWIGLTEHVTLIPGVRLHGIQDGWLLRPAIGIAWSF